MDASAPDDIFEALLAGDAPALPEQHALGELLDSMRDTLVQPVAADVAARHLEAMYAAAPAPPARARAGHGRSRRMFVAAACVGMTMAYGGLSAAGAVPSPNAIRHHVEDFFSGTGAPHTVPGTSAVAPGHTASSVVPPPVDTPRRPHGTTPASRAPGDSVPHGPTTPETAPGASGATPGNGATPPGQGGTPPGQAVTPGNGNDAGSDNGKKPSSPPGQSVTTPGQDGATPPGQGGNPPGQSVAPGQQSGSNNAGGNGNNTNANAGNAGNAAGNGANAGSNAGGNGAGNANGNGNGNGSAHGTPASDA